MGFFLQPYGQPVDDRVSMTPFKYTLVYLAYFIIMLVRPRGLFGWKR